MLQNCQQTPFKNCQKYTNTKQIQMKLKTASGKEFKDANLISLKIYRKIN